MLYMLKTNNFFVENKYTDKSDWEKSYLRNSTQGVLSMSVNLDGKILDLEPEIKVKIEWDLGITG
jgi:hypothetical protein